MRSNIKYSIVCPNNDISITQNNFAIVTKRLNYKKILGAELNVSKYIQLPLNVNYLFNHFTIEFNQTK
jgi:hypothetical protein